MSIAILKDIVFFAATVATGPISSSADDKISRGQYFSDAVNQEWLNSQRDKIVAYSPVTFNTWSVNPRTLIFKGRWQQFLATSVETLGQFGLTYQRAAVFGIYGPPVVAVIIITPLACRLISASVERLASEQTKQKLQRVFKWTNRTKIVTVVSTIALSIIFQYTFKEFAKRIVVLAVVLAVGAIASQRLSSGIRQDMDAHPNNPQLQQLANNAAQVSDALESRIDNLEWFLPKFREITLLETRFDNREEGFAAADLRQKTRELLEGSRENLTLSTYGWVSRYCQAVNAKLENELR